MEQQLRETITLHAVKDFRDILIHHIDQRVYKGAPPICGPLTCCCRRTLMAHLLVGSAP